MGLESDFRKTEFLSRFRPGDRKTVIDWTLGPDDEARKDPRLLLMRLKSTIDSGFVKDQYPYLRDRLLSLFISKRGIVEAWCAWCVDWCALTDEEKTEARKRFETKKGLWVDRGRN